MFNWPDPCHVATPSCERSGDIRGNTDSIYGKADKGEDEEMGSSHLTGTVLPRTTAPGMQSAQRTTGGAILTAVCVKPPPAV